MDKNIVKEEKNSQNYFDKHEDTILNGVKKKDRLDDPIGVKLRVHKNNPMMRPPNDHESE